PSPCRPHRGRTSGERALPLARASRSARRRAIRRRNELVEVAHGRETLEVLERPAVEDLARPLEHARERSSNERRPDAHALDADLAELSEREARRSATDDVVERLRYRTASEPECGLVRQARREENVGSRLLVGLDAPERVVEVGAPANEILGA